MLCGDVCVCVCSVFGMACVCCVSCVHCVWAVWCGMHAFGVCCVHAMCVVWFVVWCASVHNLCVVCDAPGVRVTVVSAVCVVAVLFVVWSVFYVMHAYHACGTVCVETGACCICVVV